MSHSTFFFGGQGAVDFYFILFYFIFWGRISHHGDPKKSSAKEEGY
jgi:hypothetical protein